MKKEEFSYDKAMADLEKIVQKIESGDCKIDELTAEIKKAAYASDCYCVMRTAGSFRQTRGISISGGIRLRHMASRLRDSSRFSRDSPWGRRLAPSDRRLFQAHNIVLFF